MGVLIKHAKKGDVSPGSLGIPAMKLKKKRYRKGKVDWAEVRNFWMIENSEGRSVTHPQLAAKFGVSQFTVQNRSSVEKWREQLEQRIKERDEFLATRLRESSDTAIKEVRDELSTNEIVVRTKHATIARSLQGRALNRLVAIPLDALTPRDALMMLKIGLEEERKALGLPDVYVRTDNEGQSHPGYKPLLQQFDKHREVQAMGMELLRALKKKQGQITDAAILNEVGETPEQAEGAGNAPEEQPLPKASAGGL